MKIFECNDGYWSTKLNIVDENNVLVGYDYESSCCEDFYYYITDSEPENIESDGFGLDKGRVTNLVFDKTYNKIIGKEDCCEIKLGSVFKMVGEETLYLVLVNCHNGYYSHGFWMNDENGEKLYEGCL